MEKQLQTKIIKSKNSGLPEEQAIKTLSILFQFPVISIAQLQNELQVSYNTANSIIQKLIKLDILKLDTLKLSEGQKRNKLFRFDAYLNLLEK